MRYLTITLVALLVASNSLAQPAPRQASTAWEPEVKPAWMGLSTKDLFGNEEVLKASQVEIGSLNRREVEALARAMADCEGNLSEEELVRGYCMRAQKYLRVIYPGGGALGQLILASEAEARLVRWNAANRKPVGPEQLASIRRLILIDHAWSLAIQQRLRELDTDGK